MRARVPAQRGCVERERSLKPARRDAHLVHALRVGALARDRLGRGEHGERLPERGAGHLRHACAAPDRGGPRAAGTPPPLPVPVRSHGVDGGVRVSGGKSDVELRGARRPKGTAVAQGVDEVPGGSHPGPVRQLDLDAVEAPHGPPWRRESAAIDRDLGNGGALQPQRARDPLGVDLQDLVQCRAPARARTRAPTGPRE